MKQRDTVALGFLHPRESLSPDFARCKTMVLMRDGAGPRRVVSMYDRTSSANISGPRCDMVRSFLADPNEPEWLWLLDADMTFGEDILDELLDAADPKERPIVGGLCFGVGPAKDEDGNEIGPDAVMARPLELFPTIYMVEEDGSVTHYKGYEVDSVMQVHSTGAACLLIHRSVLADPRWKDDGHPFPWFRESVLKGGQVSEDQFFCLKAGSLGYPIHINTSARTGHVKVFVASEVMYLAQLAGQHPELFDKMVGHLLVGS